MMVEKFIVYPAIDLKDGRVVRLMQGDPGKKTVYADHPEEAALNWAGKGARWIHVVNLDGAFETEDEANRRGLAEILDAAAGLEQPFQVQLGGGIRTVEDVETVLSMGVARVILGTSAVEEPAMVSEAIKRYGEERIVGAIDAHDGIVRVRGWVDNAGVSPEQLAMKLKELGLNTVIYTNIARDGMGTGLDLEGTIRLAQVTDMNVVASGGVHTIDDVKGVKAAGLKGVIIGKALYDRRIELEEALSC